MACNESLRVTQDAREEALKSAQRKQEKHEARIRECVRQLGAEVDSQYQLLAQTRNKLEQVGDADVMKLKRTLDEVEHSLARRTSL